MVYNWNFAKFLQLVTRIQMQLTVQYSQVHCKVATVFFIRQGEGKNNQEAFSAFKRLLK